MQNYSGGEGLQYHLQVRKRDMGRYITMPEDPKHCGKTAKHLSNAVLVTGSGEYATYTGYLDEEKVSIASMGIGGPSASIAMKELVLYGANTSIRAGTRDGMNMDVKGGDIMVATGAIRMEDTNREYAPTESPAVADLDITNILVPPAKALGYMYHAGVVQCKDALYGQHEPGRMPISHELLNEWEAWKRMDCKASEMESAALFITASHLGVRCGSDFPVVGNQERQEVGLNNPIVHDTGAAIKMAVEAVCRLIQTDKQA